MTSTTQVSFKNIFDLSGRVALVTGAASGFGEVVSLAFAEYGCDVACADMNIVGARQTAATAAALGRRSAAFPVDLGKPELVRLADNAFESAWLPRASRDRYLAELRAYAS